MGVMTALATHSARLSTQAWVRLWVDLFFVTQFRQLVPK
jgi:hypothetical protein